MGKQTHETGHYDSHKRDIGVQASIAFIPIGIPKKHTFDRPRREFIGRFHTQIWETFTSKYFQKGIVGWFVKKFFRRHGIMQNWSG